MLWKVELATVDDPKMRVIFEVTAFTIGKPPAAVFALPAGCAKKNGSK
jgi:hypothetical protein